MSYERLVAVAHLDGPEAKSVRRAFKGTEEGQVRDEE